MRASCLVVGWRLVDRLDRRSLCRASVTMSRVTPGTWSRRGETAAVWPGRTWPLGADWGEEATNFAVRAPEATRMWVCLFDDDGRRDAARAHRGVARHLARRDPRAWRPAPATASGPTGRGSPSWACASTPTSCCSTPTPGRSAASSSHDPAIFGFDVGGAGPRATRRDSAPYVPKSVVVHDPDFDWGDDRRPYTRWRDTVIYELHVKGMTALHDRVPEHLRGTYAGLATPAVIDYLRDLGVTAVELLPVQQFVSEPQVMARGMANYWGYNTIGFFAPHHGYSSSGDRGGQVREFKEMVRAFHAAGLEVILDVVYNHTAEGGADGPTLSFRGLDDRGFYHRVDHTPPGRRRTTTPTGTSPAAATPSTPRTPSRCG